MHQTYYHITESINTPTILKQGLVPQIGPRAKEFGETQAAIYLFNSINDAETALYQWLGDWYNNLENEKGVNISLDILQIQLNPKNYMLSPMFAYETICYSHIPTSCINVYKNNQ